MTGAVGAAAVTITVLMVVTWAISVPIRDVSIVDIVWGLGFALVAATAFLVGDGPGSRRGLLLALVGLWGLRLAGYLTRRNLGHGEDQRYVAMRRKVGERYWIVSLVTVFVLQGVLMWIVSLPVQLAASASDPTGLGLLAGAGVVLWAVGLYFEAVGDHQMATFKADPDNRGQVMDRGLWRYTRHPNYFGDFCVWWGIFLVAAETGPGRFGVVGPIVMSVLLLRVSGVALLERSIGERRPSYADYVAKTSAFWPRPPRT